MIAYAQGALLVVSVFAGVSVFAVVLVLALGPPVAVEDLGRELILVLIAIWAALLLLVSVLAFPEAGGW